MFDDPYWIALWITAGTVLAAELFLDVPVRRLLRQSTGSEPHAELWVAAYRLLIPLVPTFGFCFGTAFAAAATPFGPPPTVAFICLWSIGGLIVTVLAAVITASSLGGVGRVVYVEPDVADDLDRLLVRIERIRARRVLRLDERRPV